MGTRMADIQVGSEWAVGSDSILRAVRSRADEPGFLERYLLDDDSWIHAVGHRDRGSRSWPFSIPLMSSRD